MKRKNAAAQTGNAETQKKMFAALFTTAKSVSHRNPQSRGQGLSGESKVAILQLLQNDKD